MTIKIPDNYMGRPIKGSIERVLASASSDPPMPPSTAPFVPTPQTNLNDPENYIILPGNSHGNYSYPDLIVAKYRLSVDSSVISTAQNMGLTVQNTSKESNGRDYMGNINCTDALKLNLSLGNFTLNLRQFIDFKELLEIGIKCGKKIHDGRGNEINDVNELTAIYNEICEVRSPWRSEWLDASFKTASQQQGVKGLINKLTGNAKLCMEYDYRMVSNNNFEYTRLEPLEDCIMDDCWIDVASFNRQGLPTRKNENSHDLYYWYPRNGRVAWFDADSYGAYLYCVRDPTDTIASLGVRAARKKT